MHCIRGTHKYYNSSYGEIIPLIQSVTHYRWATLTDVTVYTCSFDSEKCFRMSHVRDTVLVAQLGSSFSIWISIKCTERKYEAKQMNVEGNRFHCLCSGHTYYNCVRNCPLSEVFNAQQGCFRDRVSKQLVLIILTGSLFVFLISNVSCDGHSNSEIWTQTLNTTCNEYTAIVFFKQIEKNFT